MLTTFNSLFDLMDAFPDEQACVDHLRTIRWRNGEFCPHCGHDKIYGFSDNRTFKCAQCRQRFSLKVGTIFHDTKLPLRKWFMAIWLITNHPKGIASTTLAKDLKITQKTAWFMLHRLRHAARTKSFNAPLTGTVEIDESYIGGKGINKHGKRGKPLKATVVGAVERGGKAVARVIPSPDKGNIQSFVRETVSTEATIVTDMHMAYRTLHDYPKHELHYSGVHSDGVHTNTIEGMWAQLKRQIVGIHHWVSPKHLDRYVGEMTWRFNRKELLTTERMNELFTCVEGRLPYKMLIA